MASRTTLFSNALRGLYMGGANISSSRRKARIAALQALYENDVAGHSVSQCLERVLKSDSLSQETAEFTRALVAGTTQNREKLDEIIGTFAPTWPVAQLSVVDRNILRLAIYEITMRDDTPPKAAINEAVEVAKLFGTDSSSRFINGVLGSVIKSTAT